MKYEAVIGLEIHSDENFLRLRDDVWRGAKYSHLPRMLGLAGRLADD